MRSLRARRRAPVRSLLAAALGLCILGTGPHGPDALGAEEPRDGEEAEEPRRNVKYVVCEHTDRRGEVSYQAMELREFADKFADLAHTNKLLRKAYREARRAWKDDPDHKRQPFLLRAPTVVRYIRLATYSQKDRAEAAAQKRQERVDERAERYRKRQQRRLDRMSEVARQRHERREELLEQAEELFEAKLQELREKEEKEEEEAEDEEEEAKEEQQEGDQPADEGEDAQQKD
ncbi:MAG: hypothetical protein ACLF0G_00945 [Candidatus Brocadiia bacterium]